MFKLLDSLLPPVCALCGLSVHREKRQRPGQEQDPAFLCRWCAPTLPRMPHPCLCCAGQNGQNNQELSRTRHVIAPFQYRYPVDRMICRFKFNRRLIYASILANAMTGSVRDHLRNQPENALPDALVPVPLHSWRHFRRGFNQADILARQVGQALKVPVLGNALKRVRATPAQSGLEAKERSSNLQGAFRCHDRLVARLGGQRLALIDDVLTTGSTISACAKVLLEAGVASVDAWVCAVAEAPEATTPQVKK